jgi:hypothetical protein
MHQKEHFANMGEWRRNSLDDSSAFDKLKSCIPNTARPYGSETSSECRIKCDNDLSCNTVFKLPGPACMNLFCNMDGAKPWVESEITWGQNKGAESWTRGPASTKTSQLQPFASTAPQHNYYSAHVINANSLLPRHIIMPQ